MNKVSWRKKGCTLHELFKELLELLEKLRVLEPMLFVVGEFQRMLEEERFKCRLELRAGDEEHELADHVVLDVSNVHRAFRATSVERGSLEAAKLF
ncbi:hypothetical protein AeRB84_008905 [Aphanomyces euteiches]|nr:hypothetical protein AeRB84_008905 [Aphanomyces euteiches]